MGLDMNLYKKTYVKNWDHMKPSERHKIVIEKEDGSRVEIQPSRIAYIEEEICYWRKANQIHAWMVKNVQDGKDDCREYDVSEKKLAELVGLCKQVIAASKLKKGKIKNGQKLEGGKWVDIMIDGKYIVDPSVAKDLLPVQSGFFFGGVEYDEYYLEDLKHTVKMLEPELAIDIDRQLYSHYVYSSSW